jgi:hypothetical protein
MVSSVFAAAQFFGAAQIDPELIVNGDFSNGTNSWYLARTGQGILSVVSGHGRCASTSTATFGIAQVLPLLQIGQQYSIKLDIFKGTSVGNLLVRVSTNSTLNTTTPFQQTFTADGSVNSTFTASAAQLYIGIINVPSASGQYFELDNVSVQHI